MDISKLVRGGSQLLTRSHKSYSLTSSPLITKYVSVPSTRRRPRGFFLCNKTGGEGSRSSLLCSAPYSTAILAQVRTRARLQLVRYRPLQLRCQGLFLIDPPSHTLGNPQGDSEELETAARPQQAAKLLCRRLQKLYAAQTQKPRQHPLFILSTARRSSSQHTADEYVGGAV